MIVITKVLHFRSICEKGQGWVHELGLEVSAIGGPAKVLIVDDTDHVEVHSSHELSKVTGSLKYISKIWAEWGMGTSIFPARPVVDSALADLSEFRKHEWFSGEGVAFSWLASPLKDLESLVSRHPEGKR